MTRTVSDWAAWVVIVTSLSVSALLLVSVIVHAVRERPRSGDTVTGSRE
jgi:hypothetical protein